MAFSRSSLLGISSVAVGILGVGGPIAWDYYKTKSAVEIRLLETSVVIEKPQKLAGLVVTYGGEEVQELSKSLVIVTNTGRTPILHRDVVQAISLRFRPDSRLLDARIEAMTPSDLGATLSVHKTDSLIVLNAPLLNPGDQVQISALANSLKPDFDVNGRIAGIGSLTVIKNPTGIPVAKARPWTVYPVGFFSLLLLVVGLYALFSSVPLELRVKRALKNRSFQIPKLDTKAECLLWIESFFSFITGDERRLLKETISMLPDTPNFTTVHEKQLLDAIEVHVRKAVSNLFVVLVILVAVAVGGWYIL